MSCSSITVCRLGPSDLPHLRMLNSLFGDAFADPETYTAEPPTEPYLKNLLSKEHVAVLAAMAGHEVVGGLVAYELEKFERARSEFYIYDLAVSLKHRRRGIATSLIRCLREIAARRSAWVIFFKPTMVTNRRSRFTRNLACVRKCCTSTLGFHDSFATETPWLPNALSGLCRSSGWATSGRPVFFCIAT